MRIHTMLLLLLTIAGPAARAQALPIAAPAVPNPEALAKWKEMKGYVTDRTDLEAYRKLAVDCADQHLYPTHPQQLLKLYHRYDSNQYDNLKLKGTDEPCLMPQKNPPRGRAPLCLRADIAYDVIISDTLQDVCGHYYRGFKRATFLGKNETMGTLFSAGRAVYPKEGSKIDGEMEIGGTYAVPLKDLLFVGPLLAGDEEKIAELREEAKAIADYDPNTHLFRTKR